MIIYNQILGYEDYEKIKDYFLTGNCNNYDCDIPISWYSIFIES